MNNAINVYTFPRYKEICALKFSSKPNFFENISQMFSEFDQSLFFVIVSLG